jgi:predicted outer membrane repeat protein
MTTAFNPSARAWRAAGCALSLALGLAAAGLLVLAGAARTAQAAGTVRPYPGTSFCANSLQECIEGANISDTIVITAGTYITSVTLDKDVSLTGVASNTVILQALPGQRVLTVTNSVTATTIISGLTFTGGDVTSGGIFPGNCGGGVLLDFAVEPQLTNLIITGNTAIQGGGLCAANFGTLSLKDSLILSNTATGTGAGGGGALTLSPAQISGGLFQGNQCLVSNCTGGGLSVLGTDATLTGTRFLSNTAQAQGGGLAATNGGSLTLVGGQFLHNQCAITLGCSGGGLYAGVSASLSGTQFISNVAYGNGGGAMVNQPAWLTNTTFQDNACPGVSCLGGGLYSGHSLSLSGAQILSNTSNWRGGGLYANSAVTLSGGLLQGNTCPAAGCDGGGVSANSTLSANGTQFINNSANEQGGAISSFSALTLTNGLFRGNTCTETNCQAGALRAGALTLNGTQFLTNTAHQGGGAISADTATLTNGLFQGNQCLEDSCTGGALLTGSALTMTGTTFTGNSAHYRGGAVLANGSARLTNGLFQANSCTQADCQGGALEADGALNASGTHWLSNTAHLYGGGVYVFGSAGLSGGLLQGNQCLQANCQGGGVFVFAGGPLTLTSMTFTSNNAFGNGGAVRAGGSAALTDGAFQNNRCTQDGCSGGGLLVLGGLALTDTTFSGNQSRLDGPGIAAGGAVTLTGGLFQGNTCSQDGCRGGGLQAGGSVLGTGTQFISNSTHFHGGGLYSDGDVTLTNSLFQGNTCSQNNCTGGGLYAVGRVTLTNAGLLDNRALFDGGGLWANDAVVLTFGHLQGNACSQDNCRGGGLHAVSDLTVTGTDFLSNTARAGGGGVFANIAATAQLNGALFQGNHCTQTLCLGGGLEVLGSAALTSTRFLNNAAAGGGGGLYTIGSANVLRGVFTGNFAALGGGFYHNGGAGQVVNSLFVDNVANSDGAGLFVNSASGRFNLLFDTFATSSGTLGSSAISVFTGSVGITDTLIAYYSTGIARLGGSVNQDYNLFSQVPTPTSGGVSGGAHSQQGQADFYSRLGGNFHLFIDSAGIDEGVDVGIATDFDGQPRPHGQGFDIGFDETPVQRLFLPSVQR